MQGNKQAVNQIVKAYKLQDGAANFPALFTVPTSQRLPAMAKENYEQTISVVTVGLTVAFESMNLIRPMSNGQIIDLADAIIDSSSEDNLSLEDIVLFLQGLTRGKYGVLYESMDIPKFMEKLEQYREERHTAIINLREEQAANHRPDYSDKRSSETFSEDEKAKSVAALLEYEKIKSRH